LTAARPRSAAERHAAAKAAIKRVEQQIDAATAHRLEILRHHDANALVAINADRKREALKLLHLRLIDQVPLLAENRRGRGGWHCSRGWRSWLLFDGTHAMLGNKPSTILCVRRIIILLAWNGRCPRRPR
jgi:hypothetical protein